MTTVTLWWAGAGDATAATSYRVESDEAASGTFVTVVTQAATDRGDGSYAPYTTTLAASIAAAGTTVELADGTNFAAQSYAQIGREMMKLGGKAGNVYSSCTRGVAGTLPAAHGAGTAVAAAHESYADDVTFGGRHVVRYRIVRVQDGAESVAALALALRPSPPPDTGRTTVYGIVVSPAGEVQIGVAVELAVEGAGNYSIGTESLHHRVQKTTSTDADAYFEVFIPRDIDEEGGHVHILTIAPGTEAELEWTIESVPDVEAVNFLEL